MSFDIIIGFCPIVGKTKIRTIVSLFVTSSGKPFEHQEVAPRSSSGGTLQANLLHNLDALALGVATGLVGAFGGIGGFLLPNVMGDVKLVLHSYAPGWVILAGFVLIALVVLRILAALDSDWRSSWAVMGEAEPTSATVGMP